MSRRWLAGVGAGAAILVSSALLVAGTSKREQIATPDAAARLRFRLNTMAAELELGDWAEAFTSIARVRRDVKDDPTLIAVLDHAMVLAREGQSHPLPSEWDFERLCVAWEGIAQSERVSGTLRKVAARRAEQLSTERRAAELVHSVLECGDAQAPLPFVSARRAMQLVAEAFGTYGHTLVVRHEGARLSPYRVAYDRALREEVDTQVKAEDPEWETLLTILEEGAKLLGGVDSDLRRARETCQAGLEDKKLMQRVLEHCNTADWARAADLLSRLRPLSHYAKLADEMRFGIRLQIRLEDALKVYRGGNAARAANDFTELLSEWPRGLRNRDVVETLARELPKIHTAYTEAEKRRAAGELRRAIAAYDKVLGNVACEGWYRREAERWREECRAAIEKTLRQHATEFAVRLEKNDWPAALRAFKALEDMERTDPRVAEARKAVRDVAQTLVRELERHCWAGSFGVADRAAAALLEMALGPADDRSRFDEIKRNYPNYFPDDGRNP